MNFQHPTNETTDLTTSSKMLMYEANRDLLSHFTPRYMDLSFRQQNAVKQVKDIRLADSYVSCPLSPHSINHDSISYLGLPPSLPKILMLHTESSIQFIKSLFVSK
jgi:hypothetical protein